MSFVAMFVGAPTKSRTREHGVHPDVAHFRPVVLDLELADAKRVLRVDVNPHVALKEHSLMRGHCPTPSAS